MFAAMLAVVAQHQPGEASQRDVRSTGLTKAMKRVCVGRFALDLPEDTQVQLVGPRIDGFEISAFVESEQEFSARVADRAAQLAAADARVPGRKTLELAKDVRTADGFAGKVFVHGRTIVEGTQARGLELERYRYEGVAIEALVHANGVSVDFDAKRYMPDQIENINRLIEKLVANPEQALPAEPGFCIGPVYFRDPLTADQGEEVTMHARLPNYPDVQIMLISAAGLKPEEQTLLERDAGDLWLRMLDQRVTKLRAEKRSVNGIAGDELAERFVEKNQVIVHSFWWEVNGTEDDVMLPHLSLTLDTGKGAAGPVPSGLSEGAAIGLWDRIVSSVRLRPAKSVALSPAPASTTLGSYAWAGETCPQTGWWLCSEGGNRIKVLGGQRQYIRQGTRMPQALLLPPQSFWERLKGVQQSLEYNTKTSWKLVDRRYIPRVDESSQLAAAVPGKLSQQGEREAVRFGMVVATGATCPVSGWWRCEEARALDGTRWFAQGSLLPLMTLPVDPSIFGGSTNTPKLIQRRGFWRLVRIANTSVDSSDAGSHIGSLPPAPTDEA